MAYLIGIALFLFLIVAARWFMASTPEQIKLALKGAGLIVGLSFASFMALTGRYWVFAAALALSLLWLGSKVGVGEFLGALFQGKASGRNWAKRLEEQGELLSVSLDLETGASTGRVNAGAFAGRALESLSFKEAMALWKECGRYPSSRALTEDWLDRSWPDWRAFSLAGDPGAMSRDEALMILGLSPGAVQEEVEEASGRLLSALKTGGGSADLEGRVRKARDILLG